jgi:hypothetical protein
MMNQRQAGNVLKRNAPQGEHPAYINNQEASWLKGMGGSGKKTKSGLRSYSWWGGDDDSGDAPPSSVTGQSDSSGGAGDGYQYNVGGGGDMNIRGWAEERGYLNKQDSPEALAEHARVANMGQRGFDAQGNPVEGIVQGGADATGQIVNALGGSGGQQTRNNTSSSVSEIDKPTHEFRQKVYGAAGDVMDKEYETYGDATGTMTDASGLTEGQEGYDANTAKSVGGNKRFADASKDTLNSQTGVREMQGAGQVQYGEASNVGSAVGKYASDQVGDQSFLSGKGVGDYMSPHTSNVINANTDQAMKAMQMGRNQIGASSQMAGAGMGSRSAIEKGVMSGEVMNNLNQQNYNALNQSYADAAGMKKYDMDSSRDADKYNVKSGQTDQDIRLRGARGMTDATDAGRKAGYEDSTMLSRVGADIEGRDQNDKDFAYDEYIEGRDWDKNNAMFGSNVLSGAPVGTTTTQNNPQHRNQKVDRFGRIISGAAGGWLASGGNPYGALAGGVMGGMG